MAERELKLEVLREGRVREVVVAGEAGHGDARDRDAWSRLVKQLERDVHAPAAGRDTGRRYFIVAQRQMEDHALLVLDGITWKIPKDHPLSGPTVSGDSWNAFQSLVQELPAKLSKRASELSEKRIESLLDVLIDVDPFQPVEARIDARNAKLRREFVEDFPVMDSATVHRRAGLEGINTAQTVNAWRRRGRINTAQTVNAWRRRGRIQLGLPGRVQGKYAYPEFQFDADGRPLKLMKAVLDALPADLTPWQRAFWLVSPKEELDGIAPEKAIRDGNDQVVDVAGSAGQLPVG